MATNTLTAMILTRAGQVVLTNFVKRMLPLRLFSTNIGPDPGVKGSTIQVPLVTAAGDAGDLHDDYSDVRSSATENSAVSTVSVTMAEQPINGFELSDIEMTQVHENFLPDFLINRAVQCANSVANACHKYILNLMTAANFTNTPLTVLAANFDLDAVMNFGADLADADWPVDDDTIPIVMGVKPSYYAKLKQDNAIQDASASQMDVTRTGRLNRRVDIFDIYQSARIPTVGSTAATENLVGFAALPDAIAWAQRPVEPQDDNQLVEWDTMIDDQTGLSLSYRSWYDPDKGKRYFTYETLFGASRANAAHLTRIRSAA